MNEIYVEENDAEIIVSVEYVVGGRDAESSYHFKGDMKKKFKNAVLVDGLDLEASCEKRFETNLNEWKLKDFCEKNKIIFEKTFWVC